MLYLPISTLSSLSGSSKIQSLQGHSESWYWHFFHSFSKTFYTHLETVKYLVSWWKMMEKDCVCNFKNQDKSKSFLHWDINAKKVQNECKYRMIASFDYRMLHFSKKIKKNTCRYHYQNLYDIIYSFSDIEQSILKLVILGNFLPFYPPKNPKNQNFEKWKNLLEISFYTCVAKITIIWCMVPEIQSETDKIFCHFGSFFALLRPSPHLTILKI